MSASAPPIDWAPLLRAFLQRSGFACDRREIKVPCYAHEDADPSLRIDVERGLGTCDVCHEGGGAIDIVMGLARCSRPEAIAQLVGEHGAASSPAPRPSPSPERAREPLEPKVEVYRRALESPGARDALRWLEANWGVGRETLDLYRVGLREGPLSLACPSYLGPEVSGIKLYRPTWGLPGARSKKVVAAEPGSRPALIGAPLLEEACGRTILVTGGEKDVLVAAASVPELVAVAHAGGEGAWRKVARAGGRIDPQVLARAIAQTDEDVVVALDVNEDARGIPEATSALLGAGAPSVRVVQWPPSFREAYPKGGVAQFLLHRGGDFGADSFRELVERAPIAAPPSPPEPPRPSGDGGKPRRRRPMIVVTAELKDMLDEAEDVLVDAGVPLYVHAASLSRVIPASEAAPARVEAIPQPSLNVLLSEHALWMAWTKGDTDRPTKHVFPPRAVIDALLAKGVWQFPLLEGVVTTPVFLRDGTVLARKGYDVASRLILDPDAKYPPVPTHPTLEDAQRSLRELGEPLVDFPFAQESDRSAAIALILTLLSRPAIAGPTPLFLIRATTAGTGKNKLAAVAGLIAHGRRPTLMPPVHEDTEWRKQLTTAVLSGSSFVVIDEAEKLASKALASALTLERWEDRALGTNEKVEGLRPVLASCGNNTLVSGDIGRRLVAIDLRADCERPEAREDFRYPQLEAWVLENRSRLVVAALTVLRAHAVAGRTQPRVASFGSFESWSSVARAALVWAGAVDPCAGSERVRAESDTGLEELRVLLAAWRAFVGEDPATLADLDRETARSVERGDDEGRRRASTLRSALSVLSGGKDGRIDTTRAGNRLKRFRGRIVDGFKLESEGVNSEQKTVWRLVQAGRPAADRSHGQAEAAHGLPMPSAHVTPTPSGEQGLTQLHMGNMGKNSSLGEVERRQVDFSGEGPRSRPDFAHGAHAAPRHEPGLWDVSPDEADDLEADPP